MVYKYIKKGRRIQRYGILNKKNMAYALKYAKLAATVLNSELKYHDAGSTTNVRTAGTIVPLFQIGQGDDNNQRDGRTVRLRSVQMKIQVSYGDVSGNRQFVRCMLIYDKENNGIVPVIDGSVDKNNGILQNTSINSYLNMRASKRYVVLFDRVYEIGSGTTTGEIPEIQFDKYFKKFTSNFHVDFSGTTGNQVDQDKNSFYFVCFGSNEGADPGPYSTVTRNVRFRFYDN